MKKQCAKEALKLIADNMTVGLGGGSTIGYLIEYIKETNLHVKAVTPSYNTAVLCKAAGISVVPTYLASHLDIAFDGCDEVDLNLNALKSGGAIHTKEKIIASMAAKYVLLVDETKVTERLSFKYPVAIEVIPEAVSYVDAYFGDVKNVKELNRMLLMTAGIVDTSLFYQIADMAIVAGKDGIHIIRRD